MQTWRRLAVVACVVLGMSGAARADWFYDAAAAIARRDHQSAVNILKPPAEQGDSFAQNLLGEMYANGMGAAQDYKTAVKWFTLAAEQGNADAEITLGIMHESGKGVSLDYKSAVTWFTLAAEQGHAMAQYNLGAIYDMGQGVVQDYVKAHMWYNIAAIDGSNKYSAQNCDAIAKKMTPAQIARAQELASKCVAQKFKNCGS